MVQTSSPSFITMLSLDDARAWMDENGAAAGRALETALESFRREAAALGYADGQKQLPPGIGTDPLRLVLDAPQGGFRLHAQLEQLGMDAELCDAAGIGCILSLMDGPERLDRLLEGLKQIPAAAADKTDALPVPPPIPPRRLPVWEAAFAGTEAVPVSEAEGRISAGQVGLYPPGVAALTAGEEITPEIAAWLKAMPMQHLFGLDGAGRLTCVKEGV
jgi:arginine/lysine/ornithine decarboxylase